MLSNRNRKTKMAAYDWLYFIINANPSMHRTHSAMAARRSYWRPHTWNLQRYSIMTKFTFRNAKILTILVNSTMLASIFDTHNHYFLFKMNKNFVWFSTRCGVERARLAPHSVSALFIHSIKSFFQMSRSLVDEIMTIVSHNYLTGILIDWLM